jgi:hypothetical protein
MLIASDKTKIGWIAALLIIFPACPVVSQSVNQQSSSGCGPNIVSITGHVTVNCYIYNTSSTEAKQMKLPTGEEKQIPVRKEEQTAKGTPIDAGPLSHPQSKPSSDAPPQSKPQDVQAPIEKKSSPPVEKRSSPSIRLAQYNSFGSHCEGRAVPEARVVQAPKYGRLSQDVARVPVRRLALGQAGQCVGTIQNSRILTYTLNAIVPPQVGTDQAVIEVQYFTDRGYTNRTFEYNIDIKNLIR